MTSSIASFTNEPLVQISESENLTEPSDPPIPSYINETKVVSKVEAEAGTTLFDPSMV